MGELGLAEAIAQLRAELATAVEQGRSEAMRFAISPIEVEMQMQLTQVTGAKAGLKWVVVSVGAEAKAESVLTHTVRFTLTPHVGDGPLLVGAPSPGHGDPE